jgi:putative ABC transport system permease protein
MRIQSVKGRPVREILGEVEDWEATRERWAFRREYRSSYRDAVAASERLVRGAWWTPGEWRSRSGSVPISLERGLAEELAVDVGDAIVWDVQGLPLATHVASLREVEWARFEPNFFVVFPEGPLEAAPQSYAALTRVADAQRRVALQRRVVEAHPNVSTLDLSQVQETLETLVARVALAIRFMALFSLGAGAVVLGGAVAASRSQRMREAALLRTLGATRRQLLRILLAEYACLGALSALTAFALAWAASWALVHFVFETDFAFPFASLLGLAAGVVALTLALGLLGSVEVFRRPPLEVLRAE